MDKKIDVNDFMIVGVFAFVNFFMAGLICLGYYDLYKTVAENSTTHSFSAFLFLTTMVIDFVALFVGFIFSLAHVLKHFGYKIE